MARRFRTAALLAWAAAVLLLVFLAIGRAHLGTAGLFVAGLAALLGVAALFGAVVLGGIPILQSEGSLYRSLLGASALGLVLLMGFSSLENLKASAAAQAIPADDRTPLVFVGWSVWLIGLGVVCWRISSQLGET